MLLVDKQIRLKIENENMICNGYKPENLHNTSYDLLIDSVIVPDHNNETTFISKNSYNLRSGEVVYIKTDVELKMPNNCMGIIAERNSVMRIGLVVSGPNYQPGHHTYIFLRVQNISSKDITLCKGQGIAQILFLYLPISPEVPYSQEPNKTYHDESMYRGVQGEWRDDWLSQIERYNNKIEELDNTENRIYGNIITIMGVFISIFSLLVINYQTINHFSVKEIVIIDFTVATLLYLLLGIIILIINKNKPIRFFVVYILFLLSLITASALLLYDYHVTSMNETGTIETDETSSEQL